MPLHNMKKIALTGGIASGKNTVADIFKKKYNIPVIDTDEIAKDIVRDGSVLLGKIVEKFGPEILNPNKSLNRKKLRDVIFHNTEHKAWLEKLLHPVINLEMQNQIKLHEHKNIISNTGVNYCLLVIPLVTKDYLKRNPFIDRVLVVDSDIEDQVARGQTRDEQSKEQIRNIIKQQISREERLALANEIIVNNGNLDKLEKEVDGINEIYKKI